MNAAIRACVGGAIGAAVGFALYRLVGCRTGACPLQSNPWISTILWAAMGVWIATGGR